MQKQRAGFVPHLSQHSMAQILQVSGYLDSVKVFTLILICFNSGHITGFLQPGGMYQNFKKKPGSFNTVFISWR